MKWKNGGGETFEIALFPPDSSLDNLNFDWRLSSAIVASDGLFSMFSGYERLLVIWQGSGLRLNGKMLEPFKVLKFSGEEKIEAKLIQESVRDLGLIYDPRLVDAQMQVHHWKHQVEIDCPAEHFFFVAQGSVTIGNMTAGPAECLHETNRPGLVVDCDDAIVIEITITSR